ncbi:hypothetical protein NDU88_003419 [Pleurodeles waltl]|uniref:Uncharacterized protein n=1 Tax=Pleurodeles waltl TaxID=8319 RepID=A0AAV7RCU3_PLEWA|nr:hypothetical protein NDU88_003419 [Pleurodeles waltl]
MESAQPEEVFFKPQRDRDLRETDSPNATDSNAPTPTEEKQEDDRTRTPEETTARGLPRGPVRRAGGDEVHRPATLWEERGLTGYSSLNTTSYPNNRRQNSLTETIPDTRSQTENGRTGGIGDPEAKFTTSNDGERPAGGGVFKPQHDRREMDSPNATDSDAPTATEEKQGDAGTRTPEETTARGLPDAR